MLKYVLPLLIVSTPAAVQLDPRETALAARLAAEPVPLAVYVIGDGKGYGASAGMADVDAKRRFTSDTPVRVASNTKTFVAATVLRLWEQGRIDLDAPIAGLVTPALDARLKADKYDTVRITVRHLLSHSGGLYDHGNDKRFEEALYNDPKHRWTPDALIGLMTDWGDPLSAPGAEFKYADADYILLGDIIQRITGKTLAAAMREQLKLDKLGLKSLYWEVFEQPRKDAPPRARQYIGEREVTGVDASFDLYGGGAW
ncbi:serine hydrolase domain-containing protein [Sphingomonas sp.]|jgi:D-alanyl-D-alanine carboxypeptidase|uniref:serine hydrolase domain-containing protein n=1 Tax=Sphingomonas sp. TaxID=28214 RepID=UPI002ED7EA72